MRAKPSADIASDLTLGNGPKFGTFEWTRQLLLEANGTGMG